MSEVIISNGRRDSLEASSILLSAQTLAKRLAVSLRTLWRLRSSGKLPEPVRLGGAVRWRTADIDAWVAAGCPDIKNQRAARNK